MKCKSLPHVVVRPTRTMASCGLTMPGSGTSWTRRSLMPFQQSARIEVSSVRVRPAVTGVGITVQCRDLACLDERLEPVQTLEQGGLGHGGRQLGACRSFDAERHLASQR